MDKNECCRNGVEAVVSRSACSIPPYFVPLARGFALADKSLLLEAGRCPVEWYKHNESCSYIWPFPILCQKPPLHLMTRQCGEHELWTIERLHRKRKWAGEDECLCLIHKRMPILARSKEAAMQLAWYWHTYGRPSGLDIDWIETIPTGIWSCPNTSVSIGSMRPSQPKMRREARCTDAKR